MLQRVLVQLDAEAWPSGRDDVPVLEHERLLLRLSFVTPMTICQSWGAREADPIENERVSSDIPTLVLAGEYDIECVGLCDTL